MADKTISALTGATTPLVGTEVLPIVQSGTTVKVSVANLTAGRAVAASSLATNVIYTTPLAASPASSAQNFYIYSGGGLSANAGIEWQYATSGAGYGFKVNVSGGADAWEVGYRANSASWTRAFAVGNNGNATIDNGNLVVGTAGKGIADSAGNLKLAITTTSVAASSVLSGGLTHRLGTYSAGATTPSVTGVSHLDIANASPTTITNFTGAVRGQMLLLLFRDGNTTITRANAYLAGAVDFTSANRATLLLMSDGSFWYEVCRSTTNG